MASGAGCMRAERGGLASRSEFVSRGARLLPSGRSGSAGRSRLAVGSLRVASSALADIIGARRVRTAAKKRLRGNGAWGPFKLERRAHYEFTISRSTSTHHLCFEPFQHDDGQIRLLTADRTPDSTP